MTRTVLRTLCPTLLTLLAACGGEGAKEQQLVEEPAAPPEEPAELSEEQLEALQGLGYLGVSEDAPADPAAAKSVEQLLDDTTSGLEDVTEETLESMQQKIAELQTAIAEKAKLRAELQTAIEELSPEALLSEQGKQLQAQRDALFAELAALREEILALTEGS